MRAFQNDTYTPNCVLLACSCRRFQKKKDEKEKKNPDDKKAKGRAKILQLREQRLKMGLKVASNKADAC